MTNLVDEIFSREVQLELSKICDSTLEGLETNHRRADVMVKFLKQFGFKEIGCGTNRIVFAHKDIEGRAFKIALDSRGILDNNMEEKLYSDLKDIVPNFYDNNGLILIAERVIPFKKISEFYDNDRVSEILDTLAMRYVLNDVGPESFLNWGKDLMGRTLILDYAYLTPIEQCARHECPKCGSPFKYINNLKELKCTNKKCKAVFAIADITGTHVDILTQHGFITETFSDEIEHKKDMLEDESTDVLEQMGFNSDL